VRVEGELAAPVSSLGRGGKLRKSEEVERRDWKSEWRRKAGDLKTEIGRLEQEEALKPHSSGER
jgi:hypothetical protein